MGEAKPFENTTISAPRRALVRVHNRYDGGGNESSKISAQSPAVMRWQNCASALVSERIQIVFSRSLPFGTSQNRGTDRRMEPPPSPNQTQCAELRNQLTCLAFSFTPSFGRNHTELLEWRKT